MTERAPEATRVAAPLAAAGFGATTLHLYPALPSTSEWLASRLDAGSIEPPALCAVHWQTRGIGRRGGVWQSKPGNVTFSLLQSVSRRSEACLGLSLVTGVAVADTLERRFDLSVELKWPNDVLIGGAKIGGLLTELKTSPGHADSVNTITGIGINLVDDAELESLGIGATSLQAAGVAPDHLGVDRRDTLIGELATAVLDAHARFFDKGWDAFSESWRRRDYLAGRRVTIHGIDRDERVLALGVNEQGALLVRSGLTEYPVYSANVSVRPDR